jgi:hypothetical protein
MDRKKAAGDDNPGPGTGTGAAGAESTKSALVKEGEATADVEEEGG